VREHRTQAPDGARSHGLQTRLRPPLTVPLDGSFTRQDTPVDLKPEENQAVGNNCYQSHLTYWS